MVCNLSPFKKKSVLWRDRRRIVTCHLLFRRFHSGLLKGSKRHAYDKEMHFSWIDSSYSQTINEWRGEFLKKLSHCFIRGVNWKACFLSTEKLIKPTVYHPRNIAFLNLEGNVSFSLLWQIPFLSGQLAIPEICFSYTVIS